MKCYLHRISYEREVSYPLLDNGLLSIGWSDFSNREFIDKTRLEGIPYLDKCFQKEWNYKPKNRYCLYRFIAEMDKGDIVIVPKYQSFDVYEILEKAVPVSEINLSDNLHTTNNKEIIFKNNLLYIDDDVVDLGFIIKVKKIEQNIPRNDYADSALTARMKMFQTNADITDLKESINKAVWSFKNNNPINLRSEILSKTKDTVLDTIKTSLNHDKLEYLIKWYCEKTGASSVDIPAKNYKDKKGDVDIIATFENIKLILYIQAKFHEEETDDWAIEQISDYYENISISNDGYARTAWVITTADKYSKEALEKAAEKNITLITGREFAEMLLDVGFSGMNI